MKQQATPWSARHACTYGMTQPLEEGHLPTLVNIDNNALRCQISHKWASEVGMLNYEQRNGANRGDKEGASYTKLQARRELRRNSKSILRYEVATATA